MGSGALTVEAPPRPPQPRDPQPRDELEALIEEARRRARRRRVRTGAVVAGATTILVALVAGVRDRDTSPRLDPALQQPAPVAVGARRPQVRNGPLTIIGRNGITSLTLDGRQRLILPCRPRRGCYDLQSISWSPDGRTLAFSVTTIGAISDYNGIHIVDVASRRDRKLSRIDGFNIAWSPDGTHIAYVESFRFPTRWGSIHILDTETGERRLLPTGTEGADMSPSWSPDGTRIAFATTAAPNFTARSLQRYSIATIRLDGSGRRELADAASAPAWSPDGRLIAYHAGCGGIKLVTPTGRNVTPARGRCGALGPSRGEPLWSPDGRYLAVASKGGIFVMDAYGNGLRPVARRGTSILLARPAHDESIFVNTLPAWQPIPRLANSRTDSHAQ